MGKQNNALLWVIVAILVVLGVVYFSQQPANGPEEETGPIVVGGLTPLTGDGVSYGDPTQRTTMMAIDEINAAGGINSRQINVVWEDGKCSGTDATTATQKLLNVDQVKIILGGACSGETLAAAALTQPARALLFSGLSSSPDITNAGDLVFRTYPSDAFQGKIMAQYAALDLGYKSAAVISENTDYAQGLSKVFSAEFIAQGENIVFDEAYNTGDTDFRTLITKLKAASPDFVYIVPQTYQPGELILKQLRELGVRAQLAGAETLVNRDAITSNPTLYEGLILVELAIDEANNPKAAAFVRAYTEKYDKAPEFPGYLAAVYDSVYLLADAMVAVGDDPEKIAAYFNTQVQDWQGTLGTFNFDENGDALLGLNLRKVVAGEVIDLGPYAPK
jgi:branched-chain amino acid transport system substrate-binding protein